MRNIFLISLEIYDRLVCMFVIYLIYKKHMIATYFLRYYIFALLRYCVITFLRYCVIALLYIYFFNITQHGFPRS